MIENLQKIDSTFTNPTGFDVIRLKNSKVDNPYISTSPTDCEENYKICTTQMITLDNKLKLVFKKTYIKKKIKI